MLLSLAPEARATAEDRYWQCAAFAREFSGIDIHGDAATWWGRADGFYARGFRPHIGAVMAFVPTGRTPLGHVATVTGIVDDRTITVTHANWSPIDGHRGQIERDVEVRDVSGSNDWSAVRVWYAPLSDLGTTVWPVRGFIYPGMSSQSGNTTQFERRQVPVVPKLSYAGLDQIVLGDTVPRFDPIGRDIMRLARLEAREPVRPR